MQINTKAQTYVKLYRKELHCNCHSPTSGLMVQCGKCGSWYHTTCVDVPDDALYHVEVSWIGPCCKGIEADSVPLVDLTRTYDDSATVPIFGHWVSLFTIL
jgi:hypothetical protein